MIEEEEKSDYEETYEKVEKKAQKNKNEWMQRKNFNAKSKRRKPKRNSTHQELIQWITWNEKGGYDFYVYAHCIAQSMNIIHYIYILYNFTAGHRKRSLRFCCLHGFYRSQFVVTECRQQCEQYANAVWYCLSKAQVDSRCRNWYWKMPF